MKKIVLTTYTKIIAWFLSIIGFTAGCDIIPAAEYGTPSADFKAKGTVTDIETHKPISNIRVIGKSKFDYFADTAFTDANGNYNIDLRGIIGFPVKIYAEDVDGEKNGVFKPDSLEIEQRDTRQIKKGSGWYQGTFEKNDVNFKLKNDAATPMYGVPSAEFKQREQ